MRNRHRSRTLLHNPIWTHAHSLLLIDAKIKSRSDYENDEDYDQEDERGSEYEQD